MKNDTSLRQQNIKTAQVLSGCNWVEVSCNDLIIRIVFKIVEVTLENPTRLTGLTQTMRELLKNTEVEHRNQKSYRTRLREVTKMIRKLIWISNSAVRGVRSFNRQ